MKIYRLLVALSLLSTCVFAQQGKNGPRIVTAANTIVNEYTGLTTSVASGGTIISVTNSTLNGNGRFTTSLQPGDLIMIIQIQGVNLNGTLNGIIANPLDTSWGQVINYNNCGRHEFAQVRSVPSATSIELDCGLQFSYSSGGTNRAQVVRVPRWTTLTVNAGASITSDDWNGTVGGIVAIEAQGNITLNGTIDATGRGFRGGALLENVTAFGVDNMGSTDPTYGAEKGEGIAGYQADYDPLGGRYGRGAAANGGGGGCGHNGGGGGGANGGVTANWRGMGIPDPNGAFTAAWNLDPQYGLNYLTTLTTANSAGGGRGGYCFSDQNSNALVAGPSNYSPAPAGWGGDGRRWQSAGLGGRPLNYSTGRLFLGGGGGAGDQNQNQGGVGGDGGGLIYIMCYGNLSGTGSVVSNGNNGANSQGSAPINSYAGRDAAGGGGAGGTIVINTVGTLTGVTATANGGNGGNQAMTAGAFYVGGVGAINEAEGPGGGGGGGHIAISTGVITRTTNGGLNGTTNSGALTEFPPNGAMRGGSGTNNATVTNWTVSATGTSICSGQSVNLNAVTTGTLPGGAVIGWYNAPFGGSPIATGATYNTGPLASTITLWVGICPGGWYRDSVVITVNPAPTPTISATPTSVCAGSTVNLSAGGGTTYTWNGGTLVNANGANQSVNPATTTTYTVTVANSGCTANAQVTVTVTPTPAAPTVGSNSPLCVGQTINLTSNTVVGATYAWTGPNGFNSPLEDPIIVNATAAAPGTYSLTITVGGCASPVSTVSVVVNPNPVPTLSATPASVCAGTSVNLTAGGGTTYTWNGGSLVNANGANQSVNPSNTTTYTVLVTDVNNCSAIDSVTINVNALPIVTAGNDVQICPTSSAQLNASGASSYIWTPASGLSSTTVANPIANPAATTTYIVTGTDVNGCTNQDSITVTIAGSLSIFAGNDVTVCQGDTVQLSTSGGTTYVWSPAASLDNPNSSSTNAFPSATTTYIVNVTDASGCQGADTITVFVSPSVQLTTSGAATICVGQQANISANATGGLGSINYTWSNAVTGPGPHVVSPTVTTTYTVSATDSLGCTSSLQTVTVTVNPALQATVGSAFAVCAGGNATVNATATGGDGTYTFIWIPGNISGSSITVSPAVTTTYSVIVTDGCGSPADTQSVSVTVNPLPVVTLSADVVEGCAPLCVNFTSTGSVSCVSSAWQFGDGNISSQSNASNCYQIPGVYSVNYTCTDANGCVGSASIPGLIEVFAVPVALFSSNPSGSVEPNVAINFFDLSTGSPTQWNWTFTGPSGSTTSSSQNPSYTPSDTGNYSVMLIVTNAKGCADTIITTFSVENPCGEIFVPNAFSPNGDGQNDTLFVYGGCFEFVALEIYSRWGEMVFSTRDTSRGWDGKWRGQQCEPGVFTYVLTGQLLDGTAVSRRGNITIMR